MKLRDKCALVVGASSGIGEMVARRLAARGWRVALVARREDKLREIADDINRRTKNGEERAMVFAHDATVYDGVPDLFDRIVEEMGGLSLVLYAAGVMPRVEPDEYDFTKDREMVEVNLLGMIAWLNQAADFFARIGGGMIAGIGSVAGDRGRKDSPVYNTSKGAQAIYLEALRNRLASRDVRVLTIKPGPVATPMTEGMGSLPLMISAREAARQIVDAIEDRCGGVVYVPKVWRWIMLVLRHIPSFIFKKMAV